MDKRNYAIIAKCVHKLESFSVKRGKINYTQMPVYKNNTPIRYGGKYLIPIREEKNFIELYGLAIEASRKIKGENNQIKIFSINQKQDNLRPLLIDIDFKVKINKLNSQKNISIMDDIEDNLNQRIVTDKMIFSLCKEYTKILISLYGKQNIPRDATYYVMKRKAATFTDEYIKDGIHIVLPDITIDTDIAKFIYKQITKVTSKPGGIFCEYSNNVIDKGIYGNTLWMLHGSAKHADPNSIYDIDYLINVITLKQHKNTIPLRLMPLKLNVRGKTELFPKIINDETKLIMNNNITGHKLIINNLAVNTKFSKTDANLIREVVMNLDICRAEDYDNWMKIILMLATVSNKDLRFYKIADEFSRRCESKYDQSSVNKIWESACNRGDRIDQALCITYS